MKAYVTTAAKRCPKYFIRPYLNISKSDDKFGTSIGFSSFDKFFILKCKSIVQIEFHTLSPMHRINLVVVF